jgi:GNAT superfamily N-acetyltransferase
VLDDGTQVTFRSIQPTDEPNVKDLFYALSQETIYYRFMSRMKHLPRQALKDFVFINHRSDVAIVGTLPEAFGEEIVAIGRYYLNPKTNLAEVAFVVRDGWQKRGIGTFLLRHLATIAKRNGIRGFTAEVLRANKPMQRVFQKSEFKIVSTPHEDVISFYMEFR